MHVRLLLKIMAESLISVPDSSLKVCK